MNGTEVARVLLVDDHEVVRQGLRALIEMEDDMAVVGEAETARQAVAGVEATSPDLVVMDVRLPDRSGISACQEITSRHPDVKVVILTSSADTVSLSSARAARASGYLLMSVGGSGVVEGLRRALRGEETFESESSRFDLRPFMALSPQEQVLAGHLACGLTNREIAGRWDWPRRRSKTTCPTSSPSSACSADPFLGRLRFEATLIPLIEATLALGMSLWLIDWFRRRTNRAGGLVGSLGRVSFAAYLLHVPLTIMLAIVLRCRDSGRTDAPQRLRVGLDRVIRVRMALHTVPGRGPDSLRLRAAQSRFSAPWVVALLESASPSGEYPPDVAVSTSFGSGSVDCIKHSGETLGCV